MTIMTSPITFGLVTSSARFTLTVKGVLRCLKDQPLRVAATAASKASASVSTSAPLGYEVTCPRRQSPRPPAPDKGEAKRIAKRDCVHSAVVQRFFASVSGPMRFLDFRSYALRMPLVLAIARPRGHSHHR